MVRNRYLRIERGRWLTEQGKSKNRCGQCGELKRGHVCRVPRAMVSTSRAAQEARHKEARMAKVAEARDAVAPASPGETGHALAAATAAALALGAPPLTMPFGNHSASETDAPSSLMPSPGPLSYGGPLSLGLSPGLSQAATPNGAFAGLTGGPPSLSGGPPGLRTQNSMDILLQASDLHRIRATGETPTPTPLGGGFDANPFKLPTVRNTRRAAPAPQLLQCTMPATSPSCPTPTPAPAR